MTERKDHHKAPPASAGGDEIIGQPHEGGRASAERQGEEKKRADEQKQAHGAAVARGSAGARLGGRHAAVTAEEAEEDVPVGPSAASGHQSTRAAELRGADEAAARQQMRQAGLGGQFHDRIVDLMPALGGPPEGEPLTLTALIDLVREHGEGAMATLERVYAAKPK